jgi:16S rRNA (cytidine1402-2'-O)-methyltransferase
MKEVDLIVAEDTRTTGFLLKHFGIETRMISYHKFNEHKSTESIVEKIQSGMSIGLVSDAGTPGISDPGYLLVKSCIDHGLSVECLPGATAFVPALILSGFANDSFCFEGFLPHKKGRQTKWKEINQESRTVILYESPHRLLKALKEASEFLDTQRKIAVCRELTKKFEEVRRGSAAELLDYFMKQGVKGEIVMVIDGIK